MRQMPINRAGNPGVPAPAGTGAAEARRGRVPRGSGNTPPCGA